MYSMVEVELGCEVAINPQSGQHVKRQVNFGRHVITHYVSRISIDSFVDGACSPG